MALASKADLCPARDLGRDLALVRRLVRQHRLADDVADGEDVVDVGAHLAGRAAMKPRSSTATPAASAPIAAAVRPAADRDQHGVECFRVRAVLRLHR